MAGARTVHRGLGVTRAGLYFARIAGDTGAERFVLRDNGARGFDHGASMVHLREAGLVPVDQESEIALLRIDWKLQRVLTNNGEEVSFHTLGKGLSGMPEYQHVNQHGRLAEGRGRDWVSESTILIAEGPHPLRLCIRKDSYANAFGTRFLRSGAYGAFEKVLVVYGKAAEEAASVKRE